MGAPPLTGTRVIDLTGSLAGPMTTMHLGDLGAEVIKVEPPWGDEWRGHERDPRSPTRSRHFVQVNRNKRSICLDLTRPEAVEVLRDLVGRADVLVANARPGVAERLGYGWHDCGRLNPGLVYCDITAFGSHGPLGDRAGYDLQVQGMAGMMGDGAGPGPPESLPLPVTDTALPLLACTAILAALLARARDGRGQRVEASLLGTAMALQAHALVRADPPADAAESAFCRALFRAYATADGWIVVAAYAERMAQRFCAAIGLPGLLAAPPWDDRAARARDSEALAALIAPRLLTRTSADWERVLAEAGVPAGPLRPRDALLDDAQVRATGLAQEVDDPWLGPMTMVAPSVRLDDTPGAIRIPAPALGADTRAVLAELGRTEAEVAALLRSGAAGPLTD